MKKRRAKKKYPVQKESASQNIFDRRWAIRAAMAGFGIIASLSLLSWLHTKTTHAPEIYLARPKGQLTFNKDIAPIVFNHCAGCHRSGQSAPFTLLSYTDVKKHAEDIAEVTARRYMPPWLPEHGYAEFLGERRLSVDEIGIIHQWVKEGTAEGAPADLSPLPKWPGDWQLGQPDLVVTMPQPYTLAAEGRDVYRNFVIPVPVAGPRYVKGVEFRPGNPRVVHHAFIKVDETGQSRRLDAQDTELGFGGMNSPATMPDGHLLGWQPGRVPVFDPDGLSWRLNPGADLVLEMHMRPSGKLEQIQPRIGLYFTDLPPTNTCWKMDLTSYVMDIPPGAQDYVVEDSYTLPADVSALAVFPHAHYLAKEMQGWATLPDGTKRWLLFIKQWDFNWQGDYRYAQPIDLPKGTVLSMHFTYDNSTNNLRNPNHPLRTVTYGPQTSDEMAELWFQFLPRSKKDIAVLEADYQKHVTHLFREYDEFKLRKDPNDADAHVELGLLSLIGKNSAEAERHFRSAISARPDFALAHYRLGLTLRLQNRLTEARAEFETALRLNPQDFKAHGNLGFISLNLGDLADARSHFEAALKLNPDDQTSRMGLSEVIKALEQTPSSR